MIEQDNLRDVILRPLRHEEESRWSELMSAHHYLGYKGIAGKSLRYIAEEKGEWLALIGWGSAVLKCRVRDEYVGWEESKKYQRLDYVMNNVRFLILPGVSRKNLASRVLSLNTKRLSRDFEAIYGHPLFLAETFVDESRYYGTCYQASNWICLGYSAGYSKSNMKYYRTGNRKAVYAYPLCRNWKAFLSGDFLPYDYQQALKETSMEVLSDFPISGLLTEIDEIMDPRGGQGKRHPLVTILAISLCGVLCGCRSFRGLGEFASRLSRKDLVRFGSDRREAPSEPTIRRVLHRIDADQFDRKIYGWLLKQRVVRDKGMAIDGKTLRGSRDGEKRGRHLLSAIIHKEGIVIGQEEVDEKTNEIKHVKPLFNGIDISGAVVTADALITQRDIAEYIVTEKKADYVFTVKGNQPELLSDIEDLELKKNSGS